MDRSRLFAVASGLGASMAGFLLTGLLALAWRCDGSLERLLWIGHPLLEVSTPEAGTRVPRSALALRIDFSDRSEVAFETFRCELNGRDVTAQVQRVGRAGVSGSLHPLEEGVNRVRVGVFGRGRFGLWVEDIVEIEIRAYASSLLDRA